MIAVIVIVALLLLCVLWAVSVQRSLVSKDEICQNALSQIGVQQQSRWDALTALVDLVKSYNEHEYDTLKDVIAQRKAINGNSSAADTQKQEELIAGLSRQVSLVVEKYPDLKANENYAKAMDSVNTYENQVRTSRMVYNDAVTKFNRHVRQFPDSIFAGMFGFTTKEYLQEVSAKADMPSLKI